MSANPTQQMFELWRKGIEESAQAWSRLLTQTPAAPPDPSALWRPAMEQWVQAWARVFAQTPVSPDAAAQYKQFLDQSIEAWSRALGQAMNTEAFAKMLGAYLDQWLVAAGPAKKAAEQATEQGLQALGLPSRAQVTGVARQIVELEERIEHLEDALAIILRQLDAVARAVGVGRPGEPASPARERA